ncbi:MAG: tetratricopeptide repeat protein, partial [Chitinophagaceae bacterium]|nr:tetratricopeptide repeat protein [Chitinophagaceae bacterium]
LVFLAIILTEIGSANLVHAQSKNEQFIDSLKKEIGTAPNDSNKVKMIDNLILSLPCDERLAYARQALAISEQTHWQKGAYISLQLLGIVNWVCLSNYTESIMYYERLEKSAQKNSDVQWLKRAYSGLAHIYKDLGQYSKVISLYHKIIELGLTNDELLGNLSNLGQVYNELGDYQKAVLAYEQALTLLNDTILADKNIPDAFMLTKAGLQITLADVYIAMQDYDKALANYNRALATNKKLNISTIQCMAGIGIGKCYVLKNEADKGIPYLEDALEDAKRLGGEEDVLNSMANAYYKTGNTGQALKYCRQAISVATQKNTRPALAHAYIIMGKIYNSTHDPATAVQYLQQAVSITRETGGREEEKEAWEQLSIAWTAMHHTDRAFDAYKQFIALKDSLYSANKAKEMTRLMMQGDFDRQRAADSVQQAASKVRAAQKLRRQRNYTYTGIAAVLVLLGFSFVIMKERKKSDKLLLNILPVHVADELKSKGDVQAKRFDNVTILFTDFVSFTTVSERLSPEELVAELHACFKVFDDITQRHGIEKIKTVGDAYLAAAGLPSPDAQHAEHTVQAAIEIRDFMAQRKKEMGDRTFGIRIGINTGTVVAGIVGVRKFAYDIWGDSVNTAARMEQNSEPGKINIAEATYQLVKDKFDCSFRGEHSAKNKGLLKMYFVLGAKA